MSGAIVANLPGQRDSQSNMALQIEALSSHCALSALGVGCAWVLANFRRLPSIFGLRIYPARGPCGVTFPARRLARTSRPIRLSPGFALELGVQFGPKQHGKDRHVEPQHDADHCTEGPIGGTEAADMNDVEV